MVDITGAVLKSFTAYLDELTADQKDAFQDDVSPGQNSNGDVPAAAGNGLSTGFNANSSPAPKIHRFRDRIFFGDGSKFTGRDSAPYGGSWLTNYGATYWEKNAHVTVLNREEGGRAALIAGAYTAPGVAANMNMAVGAITVHRGTTGNGRAFYAEAMFYGTSTGVAEAVEIHVGNYSAIDPAQPNPYNGSGGTGSVMGLSIGAESGRGYVQGDAETPIATPSYPASTAIRINGGSLAAAYQRYRLGINFQDDSLYRGTDGVNGVAIAMTLAKQHEIRWHAANTVQAARIRADNTAVASQDVGIIFNNNKVDLVGTGEAAILSVNHIASGVNYTKVTDAIATSYPLIEATGSDTNVGFFVRTKGDGQIRFQSRAGANTNFYVLDPGATPVNGVSVTGATTGNPPVVSAAGSDTNISLSLQPKGTGSILVKTSGGTTRINTDNTGIGFFGATPVAKPTGVPVTAADIHAALVSLGLIAA